MLGDQFAIAGDDLHRHAAFARAPRAPRRRFPWADRETPQNPRTPVPPRRRRRHGDGPAELARQAMPKTRKPSFSRAMRCPCIRPRDWASRGGWTLVPLFFIPVAKSDDLLRRALDHQQSIVAFLNENGHATPFKVERDFVDLFPRAHVDVFVVEDRVVERALEARLEKAVEISKFQHAVAGPPFRVHMLLQPYLRLGQRAGLVRAQDVHRSKILDGG